MITCVDCNKSFTGLAGKEDTCPDCLRMFFDDMTAEGLTELVLDVINGVYSVDDLIKDIRGYEND